MTDQPTLYLGADHRGFELKEQLKSWLQEEDKIYEVVDCGNTTYDSEDDFPDFALAVAEKVAAVDDTKKALGIVFCGSGVGVNVVANKVAGARASTGLNLDEVRHARKHDDLNVLALSSDYTKLSVAKKMVKTFLTTPFQPEPRFLRRLQKIASYEANR